jgi:hypothetical protein
MSIRSSIGLVLGLFFGLLGIANAAAPDFSTLTAGIDFSTLITALMALFVAMAGVGIVAKGGSFIVRRLGFK